MGADALRIYLDPWSDKSGGIITLPETQYCALGEDGSSKLVDLPAAPQEEPGNQLTVWIATRTASVSATSCPGQPTAVATATASARSYVSQADADDTALLNATNEATIAAQQYRLSHPCS